MPFSYTPVQKSRALYYNFQDILETVNFIIKLKKSVIFMENYLQNHRNIVIINMPHNWINKFRGITLYFFRGFYVYTPFHMSIMDLAKMRFRSTCEGEYPDLLRIVWQQWKFAFFGCVLLLKAHLFYFPKNYYWQWEIYVSAQNDFSGASPYCICFRKMACSLADYCNMRWRERYILKVGLCSLWLETLK